MDCCVQSMTNNDVHVEIGFVLLITSFHLVILYFYSLALDLMYNTHSLNHDNIIVITTSSLAIGGGPETNVNKEGLFAASLSSLATTRSLEINN